MCGISGIYNYIGSSPVKREELIAMSATLRHRGPDGDGLWLNDQVGMCHRRLSIIDTAERSAQPMVSADGRYVISYNGEVYNYLEIKKELVNLGVQFYTESDTEVVLQAVIYWGETALLKFNGMFAFALWDSQAHSMFVARDRLGIKPLYYCARKNDFIFASEIKALLAVQGVERRIDTQLIDVYMRQGYCAGENSLLSGVKRLAPGTYLTVDYNGIKKHDYWDVQYTDDDFGESYYLDRTRELLNDSVNLQLRSDVPLGVFLSGGVDSSAVVATMKKQGVERINTFSVAWDFGSEYDETPYARQIAKQFGTRHHEYMMSHQDFINFIPDYIRYMDEPVTEAAAISLYYIAKKAKQEVTVVLSGEGADEVFAGYPIYGYMQRIEQYRRLPSALRNNLLNPLVAMLGPKWKKYVGLSKRPIEHVYKGISTYDDAMRESLYAQGFLQTVHSNHHEIEAIYAAYFDKVKHQDSQRKMQYFDLKTWLLDDLLIKADRMSMAASLELRVPFLDHRFIELSASMPSKYRLKNGETKYILKKALEGALPKNILYRKKRGFPTPLQQLFRGELREFVSDILSSRKFTERGYFEIKLVSRLIKEHFSGVRDHHRVLWQLIVLELWFREFIDH